MTDELNYLSMTVKRVLVPVAGGKADREAMRLACSIARENRGKVFVLYVIEVPMRLPLDAEVASETTKGEEVLQEMERLGKEFRCEVEAEILQARGTGSGVVQEAIERDVELIVVGMPYMRRYGVFSLGNLVPYLLKNAPCPVLVWRDEITNTNHSSDAMDR